MLWNIHAKIRVYEEIAPYSSADQNDFNSIHEHL